MVDVAMLDAQVAITENAIVRHFASGVVPGPIGARHPAITPFDAFPTKDRPIVIAVADEPAYKKLCRTLGREDLATDPRFLDNDVRTENHQALRDELIAVLAARTADEWLAILRSAGLPCGPINTIADVVGDAQVRARNMVVEVDDPVAGRVPLFGCPVKLSGFADPHERPTAPVLDGDRERILRDFPE
jgi:CoA:oxalate CoA-transferase